MNKSRLYFSQNCIYYISVMLCLFLFSACKEHPNYNLKAAKQIEKAGWESVDKILSWIKPPQIPARTISVKDFGAQGDSISNDLPAVLKAIALLAEQGGGKVTFPIGQYFMKGPIHLKSNIQLHVEDGARLFFSQEATDYLPLVKVRWEGTVCYNYSPLIYGIGLKNIALTGSGVIDGAAREWSLRWREKQDPDKAILRQMGNDTIPDTQRVFGKGFLDLDGDGEDDGYGDGMEHFLRPSLVEFYEWENISIDGLDFRDSPFWTIHPVFCTNITVSNITVFGSELNDDGVDPDSCEDVLIENCDIETRDDAISIKAGRDQDAWNRKGSKNIIVRNNKLKSGANAFCIGSEMSGGVSQVFAENNTIVNAEHAINFKCNLDRGGQVEHVYMKNTTIESCRDAMVYF